MFQVIAYPPSQSVDCLIKCILHFEFVLHSVVLHTSFNSFLSIDWKTEELFFHILPEVILSALRVVMKLLFMQLVYPSMYLKQGLMSIYN